MDRGGVEFAELSGVRWVDNPQAVRLRRGGDGVGAPVQPWSRVRLGSADGAVGPDGLGVSEGGEDRGPLGHPPDSPVPHARSSPTTHPVPILGA